MKKVILLLIGVVGVVMLIGAPAQSQQVRCPPGQSGNPPYCQAPPPGCLKLPAKMALLRATFSERRRTIDILASITRRASGRVKISVQAAGSFTNFTASIDTERGVIRTVHRVPASRAGLGTGIITITYDGDADRRPQTLRLRTAPNKSNLVASRPTLTAAGS